MAPSFARYVMSFRHDNTAWGDVARDISADPNVEETWGWRRLHGHVAAAGGIPVVMRILEEMHRAYAMELERTVSARGQPVS